MPKSKNDILKYSSNIYFFDERTVFFDKRTFFDECKSDFFVGQMMMVHLTTLRAAGFLTSLRDFLCRLTFTHDTTIESNRSSGKLSFRPVGRNPAALNEINCTQPFF